MLINKITSEIKNGDIEEYHFDDSVSIKDILKTFTSLTEIMIKDAEYFFSNNHSYIYEYRYESNLIEIELYFERIQLINSKNINEY